MSGSSFLGIDSSDHLRLVIQRLLRLEGSLRGGSNTWLPVIPWQMTLVCLLTQTLGAVLNMRENTLVSIE